MMRIILRTILTVSIVALLGGCERNQAQREPRAPEPIKDPQLTNAFKFTDRVWGGGEPHGEEAFQALKTLGVKTIISVDGARPDVDMAKKYGLKYVHLPFGYDGVPLERTKEIAKAFDEYPGPVFVHCHHGQHRSPAAVATACVVDGSLSNEEGLLAMNTAGTGANYLGLWASARNAQRVSRRELRSLKVNFVERAQIPPFAEMMVDVDTIFSHLKICKKAGWKKPADHPDLEPAHEALKLRELFTEMMRGDEFRNRPEDFILWTKASEKDLQEFESLLLERKSPAEPVVPKELDSVYARVEASCRDCHAKYRNVPQRAEK